MQGREDQESGSFEKPQTPGLPSLNGTNKHRAILRNPNEGTSKHQAIQKTISQKTSEMRAIPRRPPGLARVETPPDMPRVPRPSHKQAPPQKLHKRFLIWGSGFAVLAIIAGLVGYLLANGINFAAGPSTTSVDFLTALNNKDYAQAYRDLGPAITIRMSEDQFMKQAQILDSCYGQVQDFSEVANSAKSQDNTMSYMYQLTRTKNTKSLPYKLQLQLQKDQDDGTWKVTDYGNDLGPNQPAPTCSK